MKTISLILISAVIIGATGCKTSTTASMAPANKSPKQNTVAKKRPIRTGQTVSSGEPQKNTAVAAILNNDIGGDEGMYISKQMDEQAMEIGKEKLTGGSILRVGEGIKITYDGNLVFADNTYILTEATRKDLRRIAQTLKKFNNTNVIVEAHTDGLGSERNNLAVSRIRAKVVADFLSAEDIKPGRIKVVGYGEAQPLFSNDTEEGRRQNRRIEIIIIADETLRAAAKKG